MRILKREFDIAERQLNSLHAQEVIRIAQHIHDTLCNTKSDNVWFQGVMAKKIRNLVGWMMKKNKSGGGGINGKDIE